MIMAGVQRRDQRQSAFNLCRVVRVTVRTGSSLKGFIRTAIMSELPYVSRLILHGLREIFCTTKRYHSKKQVMTKMATFIDDEARILRFPGILTR